METVLLEKSHDRSKFSCEEASLTVYIQKQASQDVKKRLAVCFVLLNQTKEVIGYYTLSNDNLGRDNIPENIQKKVPRAYRNVPVTLLGRLARDISQKGTDVGEFLLLDALYRSYKISEESLGSMAIVVDPLGEHAVKFYEKYGFIQLPDSERMFIPMQVVKKLFE